MNYVDVILPVPLEGMFTYAVPAVLQDRMQVGIRVRVPFGRTRTYLAIVARLHDEEPQGYEVKTWKIWYQGNREIKREVLFVTTYKAYQETVEYNPQ